MAMAIFKSIVAAALGFIATIGVLVLISPDSVYANNAELINEHFDEAMISTIILLLVGLYAFISDYKKRQSAFENKESAA